MEKALSSYTHRDDGSGRIPFNVPLITGKEMFYIKEAIRSKKICGDGLFTKRCSEWLEDRTGSAKTLITTSCTHALEMAAILADIKKGDEVIMPSFTFVSTANAFVLRGARIVFIDIDPKTMNMDEDKIEAAIGKKTKAIVAVHYAGVAAEMDTIMDIANKRRLIAIEDAAQGMMASYKKSMLGSIGHLGCYSFHETKNYTCGEGGAILINDKRFIGRAEIIREKGTDRSKFLRGQVNKYTWVDIGSSYLLSELNAAFLYSHLQMAEKVNVRRLSLWQRYYKNLEGLAGCGLISLPHVPGHCSHNGHTFYIKLKNGRERQRIMYYLRKSNIETTFHYVPLHTSMGGRRFGKFCGEDVYTSRESERLLRLPLYYDLKTSQVDKITDRIKAFFND